MVLGEDFPQITWECHMAKMVPPLTSKVPNQKSIFLMMNMLVQGFNE